MPMTAGIPPATDAPNSNRLPAAYAASMSSGPLSAINCLFAVTTDFPARSASRIQSPAGFTPPASSTKISISDESTSPMFSVQRTLAGTQSTFFPATARLKIWVNSNVQFESWDSNFATDWPTVPKPAIATLSFFSRVTEVLMDNDFTRGWDFAFFNLLANASPRWKLEHIRHRPIRAHGL